MAVKSQPAIVELHLDQLETLLDKVEHKLGAEDSEPLRKLLRSHQTLTQLIQEKNISIARLRKLLFGSRTERTRDAAGGRNESPRQGTNETAPPDQ